MASQIEPIDVKRKMLFEHEGAPYHSASMTVMWSVLNAWAEGRLIHAVVSDLVSAPANRVRALYEDSSNWARLFPATIRRGRVARKEGATTVIEVDHVEGIVMNILVNGPGRRQTNPSIILSNAVQPLSQWLIDRRPIS